MITCGKHRRARFGRVVSGTEVIAQSLASAGAPACGEYSPLSPPVASAAVASAGASGSADGAAAGGLWFFRVDPRPPVTLGIEGGFGANWSAAFASWPGAHPMSPSEMRWSMPMRVCCFETRAWRT